MHWTNEPGGNATVAMQISRASLNVSKYRSSLLKAAWHGFSMETASPSHLFHRYLACLCSPAELWQNVNYAEDEDDSNKRRYISLYLTNWALGATHPLGLVLDQDEGTAMQHMSIHDAQITMNGRQIWLPMEIIFDGLVNMIDQGKVLAVGEAYDGEQERTEPWIMSAYTEEDLDDTVQAFQHLVETICAKLGCEPGNTEETLLDAVTGGNPQLLSSHCFARHFLARIPKPSFTYIAPGLRIAQAQPFATRSMEAESNTLYPILLFSSERPAHQESRRAPWGEDIAIAAFSHGFEADSAYPAGLYLTETEPHSTHPFEDGCKLILPFTLGANEFARTSDGALVGEHLGNHGVDASPDIEPRSTQLYQLGFNHFIAAHDVQLKYVLFKWAEMIEEGKWEVDANGVVGGIEKWKEADTEECWQDYQLPMSW